MKTKIVSCHTADSKPVKQEVNGTVILPPLVLFRKQFKDETISSFSVVTLRRRQRHEKRRV